MGRGKVSFLRTWLYPIFKDAHAFFKHYVNLQKTQQNFLVGGGGGGGAGGGGGQPYLIKLQLADQAVSMQAPPRTPAI